MADDDDVPLLNDDDEQFISQDATPAIVEAIFVVTFDVRYGNTIEFQMPDKEQLPLTGVEYKALPSGSHRINQDFVYFRHGTNYGLACIARADLTNVHDDGSALSVVDQSQRGMCIKSVGILTSSIQHIQSYLPLLQTEAKLYLHQSSANYDRLKELFVRSEQQIPVPLAIYQDAFFADFIRQFGSFIFPLSRLILLGKRILLYSPSPIGTLCNAVYFTHLLNPFVRSLFFITVLDLPMLNTEQSYIGCITESIFKEKTSIYDVFIDCDRNEAKREIVFHTNEPVLQSIAKITRNDRNRLKRSLTLKDFMNFGYRLSQLLDRLSKSNDRQYMTGEDFHSLGLNQRSDRLFMDEYIRIHRIARVTIGKSDLFPLACSPCCSCPIGN